MKQTKSNEKKNEKKQISRQTVNWIKVAFYAVFFVSNLFSIYVDNMPVYDLESSGLHVVMAFINCVIVFIAGALIFLEIYLDKSPRVEKKDELYIQNELLASKVAITGIFIMLIVIGIVADFKCFGLVDEIRIPVNSSTCFAAYSVIGLLTSVLLLIAERSSKNIDTDADDEE